MLSVCVGTGQGELEQQSPTRMFTTQGMVLLQVSLVTFVIFSTHRQLLIVVRCRGVYGRDNDLVGG